MLVHQNFTVEMAVCVCGGGEVRWWGWLCKYFNDWGVQMRLNCEAPSVL